MESVVLFTVDCLRADHVHAYGYERETTPHIDALASEGERYRHAYSNGPGTRWAFKSMFAGRHPLAIEGTGLPSSRGVTVAERCRRRGYRTAGFSYNGFLTSYFNYDRGFETYVDLSNWETDSETANPTGSRMRTVKKRIRSALPDGPIYDASKALYDRLLAHLQSRSVTFRVTDADVVDRAIQWLESVQESSEPFFLWIHLMDAHAPFRYFPEKLDAIDAPIEMDRHVWSPWDDFEEGANLPQRVTDAYDANVRNADEQIGRVCSRLDDATNVIVTADHGEEFGTHGAFHTVSPYETMARVPLVISGPSASAAERDAPVSHVDLPRTIAALTDSEAADDWCGRDVRAIDDSETRRVYVCYQGDAWGHDHQSQITAAVVEPPWKYVCTHESIDDVQRDERLLNFERDPDEYRDFADGYAETFDTLRRDWEAFVETVRERRIRAERPIWNSDDDLQRRVREETPDEDTEERAVAESVDENLSYLGYK